MAALKRDAKAIPQNNGYADVVFALHVVEHIYPNPSSSSKPGVFSVRVQCRLIATPNLEGPGATLATVAAYNVG